jgi:hypothetical protein
MASGLQFAPLFTRREQREWAKVYLLGLLSPEMDRNSIEPIVLHARGADANAVWAMQQFIGEVVGLMMRPASTIGSVLVQREMEFCLLQISYFRSCLPAKA